MTCLACDVVSVDSDEDKELDDVDGDGDLATPTLPLFFLLQFGMTVDEPTPSDDFAVVTRSFVGSFKNDVTDIDPRNESIFLVTSTTSFPSDVILVSSRNLSLVVAALADRSDRCVVDRGCEDGEDAEQQN